jgi:hypothetical protein
MPPMHPSGQRHSLPTGPVKTLSSPTPEHQVLDPNDTTVNFFEMIEEVESFPKIPPILN